MTNEKGTRHTRESDELIEHRVKGEVEPLMASKVPVDMDSIFDKGIFESVRPATGDSGRGSVWVRQEHSSIPLLPEMGSDGNLGHV